MRRAIDSLHDVGASLVRELTIDDQVILRAEASVGERWLRVL